jgi:hypothetical protein
VVEVGCGDLRIQSKLNLDSIDRYICLDVALSVRDNAHELKGKQNNPKVAFLAADASAPEQVVPGDLLLVKVKHAMQASAHQRSKLAASPKTISGDIRVTTHSAYVLIVVGLSFCMQDVLQHWPNADINTFVELLPGGQSPKFRLALVTNDVEAGCTGTGCRKDVLPGGYEGLRPVGGHEVLEGVCGKATKVSVLFGGQ